MRLSVLGALLQLRNMAPSDGGSRIQATPAVKGHKGTFHNQDCYKGHPSTFLSVFLTSLVFLFISLYAAVLLCLSLMEANEHFLFLETNHRNAVSLCHGQKGGFTVKAPFQARQHADHMLCRNLHIRRGKLSKMLLLMPQYTKQSDFKSQR